MVRAKFRCAEKKQLAHWDPKNHGPSQDMVVLQVAYGDENKAWSAATPSGRIEMTITNPEAMNRFELGKHYFVDFTPAD